MVSTQGEFRLCQVLENQRIESQDSNIYGLTSIYIARLSFCALLKEVIMI